MADDSWSDGLLEMFDLTTNGFLPEQEPLEILPEPYGDLNILCDGLVDSNRENYTCELVEDVTMHDLTTVTDKRLLERLYSVYAMIAHSYVKTKLVQGWEEPVLPRQIAYPWCVAASKIGIAPILTHHAVDLHNWKRINPDEDVSYDNLEQITSMTGTPDEKAFFMNMTAIEFIGGKVISFIIDLNRQLVGSDIGVDEVTSEMVKFDEFLKEINKVLVRMFEDCDSAIFYNILRPYLSGWTDSTIFPNGLYYEGCEDIENDLNKKYKGGSAAQSSLIQVIDGFLGITHPSDKDKFLKLMRDYMPKKHAQFIEYVETNSLLVPFVNAHTDDNDLITVYKSCIGKVATFRRVHYSMVKKYILAHIPAHTVAKGTGDTELEEFLQGTLKDTTDAKKM